MSFKFYFTKIKLNYISIINFSESDQEKMAEKCSFLQYND